MRDIPANLNGHKLMITEPPAMKIRSVKQKDGSYTEEIVVNRQEVTMFAVELLVKERAQAGRKASKGEVISVTLTADPGDGFEEGDYVELVDLVINPYRIDSEDGRVIAGIAFKAAGLKPVVKESIRSAA
jgi:hypothetical protein